MFIRQLLVVVVAFVMTGCALNGKNNYNNQWSKAKNISYAGGLQEQLYDQELPATAYGKEGKLLDYKLGNISHPAYGSRSGVAGVNVQPYGPFEHFYWGWTVPGISHYDEHALFAWMPMKMGENSDDARNKLEALLSRTSLDILKSMSYHIKPVTTPYEHEGIKFQQWLLEQEGGHCTFERMNCVFSLYVPAPEAVDQTPLFAYHNMAGEPAWFFSAKDDNAFPRLAITQGGGVKQVNESIFYQKLSARIPGWIYLYMAPDRVGTGIQNRTIDYPYLLEKGQPLLFVRPVKVVHQAE